MLLRNVAYVTEYTHNDLQNVSRGEVILVHSSGAYLRFGTKVFLLCDQCWGALPIGITVDRFSDVIRMLKLEVGQPVTKSGNLLQFPNGCVQLVVRQLIQALCRNLPQPHLIRQAAEELALHNKTGGLSMLVQPLVLGHPYDAALLENPYFQRAYQSFSALIQAMIEPNFDAVEGNVRSLLGLGTGLTPSADDIFMGMLYIFCRLHQGDILSVSLFQILIEKLSGTHTNQISASYLKAILHGAPFDPMERVYRGICGAQPLNIEELMQIGSNSGSEMLLGMLIALSICRYDMIE